MILIFKIIIINFCRYKDAMKVKAQLISYVAKYVKFDKTIKIMMQEYKL